MAMKKWLDTGSDTVPSAAPHMAHCTCPTTRPVRHQVCPSLTLWERNKTTIKVNATDKARDVL